MHSPFDPSHSTVVPFPSPLDPGAGLGDGGRAAPTFAPLIAVTARPAFSPRREYAFRDLVDLLALRGMESRSQVETLRRLADQCGLPLPKNPRTHAGRVQHGPLAIGRRSIWCALQVDAWLDRQGSPPPVAAAAAPPLPAPLRADLRSRARMLAGGR